MEFYTILICILLRFPGCIFVSVIYVILVVLGGFPSQPYSIGAEEVIDPGFPPHLASVYHRPMFVIVYAVYAVCGIRGITALDVDRKSVVR